MKRWKKTLLTALALTFVMTFPAFAGEWKNDFNGWWFANDDGSYPTSGWYWLDGNNDGVEECYYFGTDGYLKKEHGRVDGHQVDENGAWIVDGKVQRREAQAPAEKPAETPEVTDSSDPLSVYLAAEAKNATLDSMDTDANYKITMSAEGVSITMGMDMNMKIKNSYSDLQFIATGNMDMFGSQIPMSMFYVDGYYYMDSMGMKMKQAMPMTDALEAANSNTEELLEIEASMMKNLQMRKEGENTILSYTMDVTALNDYMGAVTGSLSAEDGIQASYNIRSANGEVVINKDGYYTSQKVYIDMDMTMSHAESGQVETISYIMDVSMNIHNPGQPVDFEIPSIEGYEEVTAE